MVNLLINLISIIADELYQYHIKMKKRNSHQISQKTQRPFEQFSTIIKLAKKTSSVPTEKLHRFSPTYSLPRACVTEGHLQQEQFEDAIFEKKAQLKKNISDAKTQIKLLDQKEKNISKELIYATDLYVSLKNKQALRITKIQKINNRIKELKNDIKNRNNEEKEHLLQQLRMHEKINIELEKKIKKIKQEKNKIKQPMKLAQTEQQSAQQIQLEQYKQLVQWKIRYLNEELDKKNAEQQNQKHNPSGLSFPLLPQNELKVSLCKDIIDRIAQQLKQLDAANDEIKEKINVLKTNLSIDQANLKKISEDRALLKLMT